MAKEEIVPMNIEDGDVKEQENEPAVIEVPKLPSFNAEPVSSKFALPPPDKNMGIPKWMLDPVKIPSNLSDKRFSLPLSHPSLSISERIRDICSNNGISHFFPVQTAVMEALLSHLPENSQTWKNNAIFSIEGKHPGDLLVSAPTGSGKTLAYVIPIVETLSHSKLKLLEALVILPTIDLVKQVKEVFDKFTEGSNIVVIAVSGGGNVDELDASPQNIGFKKEQELIMGTIGKSSDDIFGEDNSEMPSYPSGCHILITTPGRLVDHLTFTPGFTLNHLRWLIIDEADRLLNQSFNECLQKSLDSAMFFDETTEKMFSIREMSRYSLAKKHQILDHLREREFDALIDFPSSNSGSLFGPPTHLQKILFSATLTRNPGKLSALHLVNPRLIATINNSNEDGEVTNFDDKEATKYILPSTLKQFYLVCEDSTHKPLYFLKLLADYNFVSSLCFTKSVENAQRLFEIVEAFAAEYDSLKHMKIAYYSSNLSVASRKDVLNSFREGKINILICTDALARGIDIEELQDNGIECQGKRAIINYDISTDIKTYIHRSGRTARAGKEGEVFNLLVSYECRYWKETMKKHFLWASMKSMKIKEDETYEEMSKLYQTVLLDIRKKYGMHMKMTQ